MKVYLSGKMTGLSEEKIWKNFRIVESWLAEKSTNTDNGAPIESIMNPAVTYAMQKYDAFSYEDWLHVDFAMLDACDGVVLLPNWKDSMGAKREIAYAYKHNKFVFYPVLSFTPRNEHNKKFKFDGEKYNAFEINPELTKQIALEVEKYDVKKKAEALLDSFAEDVAAKKLASEVEG